MENSKLAALQAKRGELIKAISMKQKEMDCFDVSCYYTEFDYQSDMQDPAIDNVFETDYKKFRTMYDNHINMIDKSQFVGYQQLEEELKELENELAGVEEAIGKSENE